MLRLRDSIIKMGEELEKAAESEAREKETTRYYQRRMEEMKADMDELVQRELESSRRRVELVRGCCPHGLVWPQVHGGGLLQLQVTSP